MAHVRDPSDRCPKCRGNLFWARDMLPTGRGEREDLNCLQCGIILYAEHAGGQLVRWYGPLGHVITASSRPESERSRRRRELDQVRVAPKRPLLDPINGYHSTHAPHPQGRTDLDRLQEMLAEALANRWS
jgi:hypothetical protein